MFPTDQATAASTLPTPAAVGAQGFFTNGNPASGTPATILDADFLNMIQQELINIVEAAGETPSKTTYNQVLTAIKMLMQQAVTNVGADTGAANAYVVAFAPALTEPIPWVPFWIQVKTANTGPSTLNATGTAKPLLGGAHLALQGGELVANGNALVYWNPTLASGAGSYVLLFCSGAPVYIAPAAESSQAVNLGQFAASFASSGYQKLANGLIVQWMSVSSGTGTGDIYTLPLAFPNGALFGISCDSGAGVHSTSVTSFPTSGSVECYGGYNNSGTPTYSATDYRILAIGH